MTKARLKSRLQALSCAALALPLASCITVKSPEKPIEINLNVAITQEVRVRLERDVEQMINRNPQAFPQTPAPGTRPQ